MASDGIVESKRSAGKFGGIPAPNIARLRVLIGLVALLFCSWLASLFMQSFSSGMLFVFPIGWLCLFFYLWRAPKTGLASSELRRKIAVGLVVGGLSVAALGAFLLTFKIAWMGVLMTVSGLTLIRLGVTPWTRVVAYLSLIWVAWPLPGGIYERIDGRIQGLGFQTAVAVFDLLGVPVFADGNILEFRARSLDSSIWVNGPDSFVGLLLFALLTLVWMRRTLVPSLLTLLSIPLIAWVGEAARILLWYWLFDAYALDLSSGWPLVALRSGVFLVQILLILMVNWGVNTLLLPVLADPNARANVTAHSLYNVVTLWPLQISITAQQADQDYLGDSDDEDESKVDKRLVTRRMPDSMLARQATDPWRQGRLWWSTLAVGGLALVLSAIANTLPAAKPMSLPRFDEQAVNGLANVSMLEGLDISAQFTNAEVQSTEDQFMLSFNLAGSSGPVTFTARFPSRNANPIWTFPKGMTASGPAQAMVVEDVTIFEASFVGQMGAKSMGWYAAMLPTGESLPEQGLWHNLQKRLSNSILGRVFNFSSEQMIYETALLVDSQSSFSERQKREYRTLLAKLSQRLATAVGGIQP